MKGWAWSTTENRGRRLSAVVPCLASGHMVWVFKGLGNSALQLCWLQALWPLLLSQLHLLPVLADIPSSWDLPLHRISTASPTSLSQPHTLSSWCSPSGCYFVKHAWLLRFSLKSEWMLLWPYNYCIAVKPATRGRVQCLTASAVAWPPLTMSYYHWLPGCWAQEAVF